MFQGGNMSICLLDITVCGDLEMLHENQIEERKKITFHFNDYSSIICKSYWCRMKKTEDEFDKAVIDYNANFHYYNGLPKIIKVSIPQRFKGWILRMETQTLFPVHDNLRDSTHYFSSCRLNWQQWKTDRIDIKTCMSREWIDTISNIILFISFCPKSTSPKKQRWKTHQLWSYYWLQASAHSSTMSYQKSINHSQWHETVVKE